MSINLTSLDLRACLKTPNYRLLIDNCLRELFLKTMFALVSKFEKADSHLKLLNDLETNLDWYFCSLSFGMKPSKRSKFNLMIFSQKFRILKINSRNWPDDNLQPSVVSSTRVNDESSLSKSCLMKFLSNELIESIQCRSNLAFFVVVALLKQRNC